MATTATTTAAALLALHGITLHDRTTELKLGGLRVILANTVHPGHEHGYPPADDDPLFDLLAHPAPTMLVLHHQLMTSRIPYYLPPGVPAPAARRLLDQIDAANPATLVTTGHTHRHRRRQHGRVVVTEVGSTKDHPGHVGRLPGLRGRHRADGAAAHGPDGPGLDRAGRELGPRRVGPVVSRPAVRPLLHPRLAVTLTVHVRTGDRRVQHLRT